MTDAPAPPAPHRDSWSRERLETYFRAAAFVVLAGIATIAAFRTYFALEAAIIDWLRPQWVALAQAGFGLVILALVVWLLRAWVIGRAR